MGFFLAWQDSLANRTWKVSGTHSTSLAKLQNTWLTQVISQFPNDKKQEKRRGEQWLLSTLVLPLVTSIILIETTGMSQKICSHFIHL